MPCNEKLVERIRKELKRKKGIAERKMFGGICFSVNGNMACGVEKNNLVVRVELDNYIKALKSKYTRPMDFTGKPLRGFIYVLESGYKSSQSLKKWINLSFEFAKSLPSKR